MVSAADRDQLRRCRSGVYDTGAICELIEGLMNGTGESPAIRKLRESVLTDRKAELCVGKLAASCPDEVGMGRAGKS